MRGVIAQLDQLIVEIRSDQARRIQNQVDEPTFISIFNTKTNHEQSTNQINGQFVHSQLLIDCLLRMKSISTDKKQLVEFCQQEYRDNDSQLSIVSEFEQDYEPNQSVWWYTRPTFLQRLLNKALRVQNIDLLFLFRFFIRDIAEQLNQHRCSSPMRLYRGQLMSQEELDILRNSIGELISMNSLLSTSISRPTALFFLGQFNAADDLQRVLFEIDADPRRGGFKPFANITSLSYFSEEREVLVMLGSIFRLNDVLLGEDRVWIIRMTLCSDNDHDSKAIFDHMTKELDGGGETSLISLGHVLCDMGKFDQAEKCYRQFLNELPPDHPEIARCYKALGDVTSEKGDYDSSLAWLQKSLEASSRTLKLDETKLACIHNSIGEVHRKKGDLTRALESYTKALMIWKQLFGEDHPDVAMCFNNMGGVYQEEKNYPKALECHQNSLTIWEKHLPADHSYLAVAHNNIGEVHRCLNQYDVALEHFQLSLKIKSKSLPYQHSENASTIANIGVVHEKKGDCRKALSFYEEAAIIYRHVLPPSHPDLLDIEQDIQRVSMSLK